MFCVIRGFVDIDRDSLFTVIDRETCRTPGQLKIVVLILLSVVILIVWNRHFVHSD